MKYEEKRAHWSSLVKEWQQSHQDPRTFCEARGLKASTFKYWAAKLTPPGASFKPVTIRSVPVADLQIKIETPQGVKIWVPRDVTAEELRVIFSSLDRVA